MVDNSAVKNFTLNNHIKDLFIRSWISLLTNRLDADTYKLPLGIRDSASFLLKGFINSSRTFLQLEILLMAYL